MMKKYVILLIVLRKNALLCTRYCDIAAELGRVIFTDFMPHALYNKFIGILGEGNELPLYKWDKCEAEREADI